MARVIIVSNRLPVSFDAQSNLWVSSAGGLATAVSSIHDEGSSIWIGWAGSGENCPSMDGESARMVPVQIPEADYHAYYDGISNGILWPLFHYMIHQLPYDAAGWDSYRRVNEVFADTVAGEYRNDDIIWVHDYHLLLLPAMLRKRLPRARIGFFLHIPFPSSELFRVIPWREEILSGILGADIAGFQTFAYARHFSSSIVRVLGAEASPDHVEFDGRRCEIGVFPIGIDPGHFQNLARSSQVREAAIELKRQQAARILLLGVDRLDYTKGIPRRLLAIERFFDRFPEYRGRVRFLQIAVPTRETTSAYKDFRELVNQLVGRINSRHGTLDQVPVHFLYRSLNPEELVSLYLAADVMVVTPLRDGMNLVAKEFVAAREEEAAALILSEFAGACAELGESLLVNPYDIDSVAERIRDAIEMSPEEKRSRMAMLRQRVVQNTSAAWASSFVKRLENLEVKPRAEYSEPDTITPLLRQQELLLFLDYDGTLVPLRGTPESAAPDGELRTLVARLLKRYAGSVWIVTGRSRSDLDDWFPDPRLGLIAEHGLCIRRHGVWSALAAPDTAWKEEIRRVMISFAERTPGSRIEEKPASVAWHYRLADRDFGGYQSRELSLHLLEAFSNKPVQVIRGKMCVEVRAQGVHKGSGIRVMLENEGAGRTIVAMGDDRTDEDMFVCLPADAVTIKVGAGATAARFRVRDESEVRALLRAICTE